MSAPERVAGVRLVAEARTWLGVPFRHQGCDRAGVDCVGLVVVSARALGVALADRLDYAAEPCLGALRAALADQLRQVVELAPGVVVLLRMGVSASHVALWTGAGVIHAYKPRGGVIEHRLGAWRWRVVALYALPGVEG
jgi:cell wall-associated NlpC family hydrolase